MKIKYLGKLMPLALITLLLVSCSSEDSVKNEQAAVNKSLFAKGSDFSKLLNTLYPSGWSRTATNSVDADDSTYTITDVTPLGAKSPAGYIVETMTQDYYYEYSPSKGTLKEYSATSSTSTGIFDLNGAPNFNPITFPVKTPPKGISRFFGWKLYDGLSDNCYKNMETGECFRKQLKKYYVFGVAVKVVEMSSDEAPMAPAEDTRSCLPL